MAASSTIYSSGSLNVSCLILDQGSSIRREIAGLGNDWTKIGIAFACRVVGVSSLASAAVTEGFLVTGASTRLAFGLKNNTDDLVGQVGCKFIGWATCDSGSAGWLDNYISNGHIRASSTTTNRARVGCYINGTDLFTSDGGSAVNMWYTDPSAGTEETTNFRNIQAITIEIVDRGQESQALIIKKNASSVATSITQSDLETAIVNATNAFSTVLCPASLYNLNDINCVYIQWPFINNRLLVFGPTSGSIGSPYVMRLS